MEPLRVEARLCRALVNPGKPVALDALLGAAVALREDLIHPSCADEVVDLELPLARSSCGRYWLASFSEQTVETRDRAYINRRPLVSQLIDFGDPSIKSTHISAGPNKGYRIPIEIGLLEGDKMTWWCIGESDEIRSLLALVHHIGKRRAVGRGKVREWRVEPCEPWGDGFPVVRDGRALRPLPVDHEGVTERRLAMGALTPPYWMRERWGEVLTP